MRDSLETRERLDVAFRELAGASCVQVIRFRRHTVGSAAGHVMDVVVDEITSAADTHYDERVGRRGEPGVLVVAHSAHGELGRFEVHPVRPDFESHVVPPALQACARTGAAFELCVEHECVLRKHASDLVRREGYRDAPSVDRDRLRAAGFVLSDDGNHLSHHTSEPPRLWAAGLLILLGVGCFPITCLAMLFREPREALLGMLRNSTRGWQRSWELEIRSHAVIRTSASDQAPTEARIDLGRTLLVAAWPRGWTLEESGRELVAIDGDGLRRLPCPAPELIAEFATARAGRRV